MAEVLCHFHASRGRKLALSLLHILQALPELLPTPLDLLHGQSALAEALCDGQEVYIRASLCPWLEGHESLAKFIDYQQNVLFCLDRVLQVVALDQIRARQRRFEALQGRMGLARPPQISTLKEVLLIVLILVSFDLI